MHTRTLVNQAMLLSGALAQTATQLWNFTSATNIENSIVRPNGHILFTSLTYNYVYSLDPSAANPQASVIATLPGVTASNGIAQIGHDKFAVLGGIRGANYQYTNENLFTLDFSKKNVTVSTVTTIPDAIMLNGLAAVPANPHIVLAADSRVGGLFRINTKTGVADLVFQDEILVAPANSATPIGINGLKTKGGYVYFTITARGLFARAPISDEGEVVGDVEIVSYAVNSNSWDDFVFGDNGVAYVCQGDNSILEILPDGSQQVFFGGNGSLAIAGPTSAHWRADGHALYVTTRGGTFDGVVYSGQVVEINF